MYSLIIIPFIIIGGLYIYYVLGISSSIIKFFNSKPFILIRGVIMICSSIIILLQAEPYVIYASIILLVGGLTFLIREIKEKNTDQNE